MIHLSTMDKRRQSILRQDGRMPLQETVIPDFPEEDTATVTVTKLRRVSFGANFVKEFIVGSAVSTEYFSEYEQAVSSSDSSNSNSSRSGILDQSTFQCEDNALNLCVKPTNHDEIGPLKKKFCLDKQNIYSEINDKNNENIWDFNVSNGSNIFTEKNMSCSNKPDPPKNNVRCNKNVNLLNDSSMTDKQFQNKRNESELNSSKLNETLDKKSKVGKFSSTIFFSADSPTADVEFTEGCISLAKSIFDKKKKDMTVYIKGTPKDSKKDDERDGSNTVVFESDNSDVGMKLTKCMDETESESDLSTGNFSNYFSIPKENSMEKFDESHENIENVPFHMYSLSMMLGRRDNSQDDAELEKSLFHQERSLTEMLRSDPLKTTMTDSSSLDKDNTEECDMEISGSDMVKTSIVDEDFAKKREKSVVDPVVTSSPLRPPAVAENDDCLSPVFSMVSVEDDFSLTSEDTTESELSVSDPLKISIFDDLPHNGNENPNLELSNCSLLKTTESEIVSMMKGRMNASSSVEGPEDSDKNFSLPDDNQNGEDLLEVKSGPSVEESKEIVTSLAVAEAVSCSLLKGGIGEMFVSSTVKVITRKESSVEEELSDAGENEPPETLEKSREEETPGGEDSFPVSDQVNREIIAPISPKKESTDCPAVGERSRMELQTADPTELSVTGRLSNCEMDFSDFVNPIAAIECGDDARESSFLEDREESAVFDTLKASTLDISSLDEDKIEFPSESSGKPTEKDNLDLEMSVSGDLTISTCDLKPLNEKSPSKVEDEDVLSQVTHVAEEKEESLLQKTRFVESSFTSESSCDNDDRTSLGDRKILDLLKEQSEEPKCCWRMDSINPEGDFWSFSFPILKSSAIMKFRVRPPKDKSLVSFSVILDGSMELRESNDYQLDKDRVGIEFAFGKLKNSFQIETRGVDNVHKMPLFLDKMNLIAMKMNGIMNQIIRILKDYPGSKMRESVLSFRIYSFPLLFSYLVAIDLTDPFQLSENSVSVKKHFGNFNVSVVKSIFGDCLGGEDFLVRYVRTLTQSVVGMEREVGSVTKRSHIRLIK